MKDVSLTQKEVQILLAEKIKRQKELSCIYEVTRIIKQGKQIEETLQSIIKILPRAWQFADFAFARIKYDGKEYKPEHFKETRWIQKQTFETFDKKWGAIDIFYSKQFPQFDEGPFLLEERQLLENISTIVANYLNSKTQVLDSENNNESENSKISFQFSEKIDDNIDNTLQRICSDMPKSWQYPDFAVARIFYDGKEYLSSDKNFKDSKWILKQSFTTLDGINGSIELFYLKDFPVFDEGPYLKSERELLNNIANLITGFLNILKGQKQTISNSIDLQKAKEQSLANHVFDCISEITEILRLGLPVKDTFDSVVENIAIGWQFKNYTYCYIKFENQEYKSNNYSDTEWYLQEKFKTINNKEGFIRVGYLKEFPLADNGPFFNSEVMLIRSVSVLITGFLNVILGLDRVAETEDGLKRLIFEKNERLKELACINQTTSILSSEKSIEKAFQQIVYILPEAWQYINQTVARITFDGKEYVSPNFKVTKWRQRQPFLTIDDKMGEIEIFYTKEFPVLDEGPFMKEERDLINNLANLLCNYLNSLKGEAALQEQNKDDVLKQKVQAAKDYLQTKRKLLQNFMDKNNYDRDIFHDLMKFRVREILIISNLYDAYSLEREGKFSDYILGEYYQLNLTTFPRITGVSSYEEALEKLYAKHYDIIIIMVGVDKSKPLEIAGKIKNIYKYIPIYILLNNNSYIEFFQNEQNKIDCIDNVFVWNGDSRIFFAMVKHLEDYVNAENDTKVGFSRIILLVEDSAKYYSRYLPLLYQCVMQQTRRIIEDVSSMDELYKVLRLRVRPKILIASNYEEAIEIFLKFKEYLLCLITDVKFQKNGIFNENAGFELVNQIKSEIKDLPTIIQSSDLQNAEKATELKCVFINKNSNTLALDIKNFISHDLGFGDFIYTDSNGNAVDIAKNMNEFEDRMKTIPTETLLYHAQKNHFSLWLTARGEIQLAKEIAPKKISDFKDADAIREYLVNVVKNLKFIKNKGKIVEFDESLILEESNIIQLCPGSLGGKGRGLAFIHTLIFNFDIANFVEDINIRAPRTFIIGTDEFEDFLENNHLAPEIFVETNYENVKKMCIQAHLSDNLKNKLAIILAKIRKPLAVRSSGLFEDSLMQPFAGIFETYLLPNNHPDLQVRLEQLMNAIKLVYASVYSETARGYIHAINYKIEEERMAVIIQEVVGNQYDDVYYPHISGVAQSYNYYPFGYMQPEDGFAVAAIGLGTYVVEGEKAYRFSPRYPTLENSSPKEQFLNSQVEFFAVDLKKTDLNLLEGDTAGLIRLDMETAERHNTIVHCASVYNAENNIISPGIDKPGPRIINFADILKYNYIPLSETIIQVLDIVKEAIGTPVEIEFSVDLNKDSSYKSSFYLLQIKPLIGNAQDYEVNVNEIDKSKILLFTDKGMGNGLIDDIKDVIFVDKDIFDKSQTLEIAKEIDGLNTIMIAENKKYVLIGPGRWGTRDRWIGIPVTWPQISNAKIIIETSLENFPLEASSGSHFFHNVTSMNVGYFSIHHNMANKVLNWDILKKQKLIRQTRFVKHIEFEKNLKIRMDGKKRISVITYDE